MSKQHFLRKKQLYSFGGTRKEYTKIDFPATNLINSILI